MERDAGGGGVAGLYFCALAKIFFRSRPSICKGSVVSGGAGAGATTGAG